MKRIACPDDTSGEPIRLSTGAVRTLHAELESISGSAHMSSLKTPSPAKRADAQRNRDKILAAARSAFADPEAEVSMAEISRRAGVGMATLYRNFPGRQELLEALYIDEVNGICEATKTIDGETPGAILTAWLHRFFA